MRFRRIIFWIHLLCGVVAGVVIAIMSVTGIAIAFEEEILAWIDRDVSRIERPTDGSTPRTIDELRAGIARARPGLEVSSVTVPREPDRAYEFWAGREGPLYVDPFTGAMQETRTHGTHEFIHTLEEWHRWLGAANGTTSFGRLVTGVCNLAFLVLCVTGLYLWFPRRWVWPAIRPSIWFASRRTAKARDFNWHNVFGFWSLPVLVVLVATAVVISFEWGHRVPFLLAGEEPPKARNYGMMRTPPAIVPPPPAGAEPISPEAIIAHVARAFPEWTTIGVNFADPSATSTPVAAPVFVDLTIPDPMPSRAYVPVEVNPYTGEILQAIRFDDRSPGLRARVWIRFLHTGAAFGVPGKIIATVATAASLVLVYTGFALAWRRFVGNRRKRPPVPAAQEQTRETTAATR